MDRRRFISLGALGLAGAGAAAAGCQSQYGYGTATAKKPQTVHQSLVDGGHLVVYTERKLRADGQDRGYFIVSIDGVKETPKAGRYWVFSVNGAPIDRSPLDFIVQPGDEIVAELT